MATDIEELIQYWKDRLRSTPSHTTGRDMEAIQSTIAYLERLNELWKQEPRKLETATRGDRKESQ